MLLTTDSPAGRNYSDAIESFVGASVLLFLLSMSWEGLPLILLGVPIPNSRHIVSAILIFYTINYFVRTNTNLTRWEWMPLLLLAYATICTVISATTFYPQPISGWLLALYSLSPLLLIFFCRVHRLRSSHIINVVVYSSLLVSMLVVIDRIYPLSFLENYMRLATTDIELRRIVLYKTQLSITAGVFYARTFTTGVRSKMVLNGFFFLLVFGCLASVMESRITLAALLMAVLIFTSFMLRGAMRMRAFKFMAILAVPMAVLFLQKYWDQVSRYGGDYIAEDASIQWRLLTLDYYSTVFEKTHGLGFGVMSTGLDRNNPMAFGQLRGGEMLGIEDYNLYLADTGIMGALYQFGYLGLALMLTLSIIAMTKLVSIGYRAKSSQHLELGIIGLIMTFYVLSPWPTNFFTLEWSIFVGMTFWCIAALAHTENSIGLSTQNVHRRQSSL